MMNKVILLSLTISNTILLICLLYVLGLNATTEQSNHANLFTNQSDILTMLDEQKAPKRDTHKI